MRIDIGKPYSMNDFKNIMDDELFSSGRKAKKKNSKKSKEYKKFIENETKQKYAIPTFEVDISEKLDSNTYIAWNICNKKYKQVPSELYLDSNLYSLQLLEFLKNNGVLISKKISECDITEYTLDSSYLFEYKGYYISCVALFTDKHPDGYVSSLGITHPVHINPDITEFNDFLIKPKETAKIGIIKMNRLGPMVSWIEHTTDIKFDYKNYNDDFVTFYDDLKNKLTDDNTKTGLYLLYGEAGTGKSSTIRHLITEIDRPVVFIPPQMINCLSSPEFTDLVLNALKGSILVIEDAEKALMKRETEDGFFNSELVSSILNLTDGLYADLAHTSIIATYNCDRNLIDPALLRKGRLRSEYHFQKLTVDKSQDLMDDLGHNVVVENPMTLADIFNYEKQYTNKKAEKKRSVGFGG